MNYEAIFWYFMDVVAIGFAILVVRHDYKKAIQAAYRVIMTEICQIYFCGHNVYAMIQSNFFQRFGDFNHEGFCYTVSSVIMLGLQPFETSRVVRGHVHADDFSSLHSWVEVRLFGLWWVIDPCMYSTAFTTRRYFRRCLHPKVMKVYDYQTFWGDKSAQVFRERLEKPQSSHVFVDIYLYYTPKGNDNVLIANDGFEGLDLPDDDRMYYLFPPEYGFWFSQRIVNEFMARPTRKSPRRRTIRRLEGFYKKKQRRLANTPA